MSKRLVINKAKCKLCGDIVVSKSLHQLVWCKCGEMFVDGGNMYTRRGARTSLENIIEMSLYYDDEEEHADRFDLKKDKE